MSKKTEPLGIVIQRVSEDNFFLNPRLETWLPLCSTHLMGGSENWKETLPFSSHVSNSSFWEAHVFYFRECIGHCVCQIYTNSVFYSIIE